MFMNPFYLIQNFSRFPLFKKKGVGGGAAGDHGLFLLLLLSQFITHKLSFNN